MCHRQPGGTKESEMKMYTIDAENSITALGSQQADFEGEIFASQQELTDLAAKWPGNRLVDVWNGIPGLTPVKKFKDQQVGSHPHLEGDPEPGRRQPGGNARRARTCEDRGHSGTQTGQEGRTRGQGQAGQDREDQARPAHRARQEGPQGRR
jgi:hypothetical protein